jgi:lipopolysaccharide export system permease protein
MARPPVRILSRYLLRQHFAPLVFSLAALTILMLLNQVAKQLGNLVGKGLPWTVIVEVFVLSVPFIVAMTLPMAVLVAVLHTMSRLAADHEITAMTGSGVSVSRIARPVLLGGVVVSLAAFLWNDQVLPRSNHELRTLLVDIQRKKPSFALKEQVINEVVPGQFFLRAGRIDQSTNRLRNVTIYDLGDANRRRIISADSGSMAYTPGKTDLYLTLLSGDIQEVRRGDDAQFNLTFFHVNRIRVAGVSNQLVRTENDEYRSDREMTLCDMQRVVASARLEAELARRDARATVVDDLRRLAGLTPAPTMTRDTAAADPGLYCRVVERLGHWLLPTARAQTPPGQRPEPPAVAGQRPRAVILGATAGEEQRVDAAHRRAAVYQVEIHKKLAIAAACIVFAMLGVPVALRFPRGGAGLVIGTSVIVFAVYYVGLIGGEDLGDRLIVSPFLSMWTPNLLFGVIGVVGLWVMRRASPTARGGDWSDLREALVRVWRYRRRPR